MATGAYCKKRRDGEYERVCVGKYTVLHKRVVVVVVVVTVARAPVRESARVENLCALLHICRGGTYSSGGGDDGVERDEKGRICPRPWAVSIFKEYTPRTWLSILLPAQTPRLAPICPPATAPLAPHTTYDIQLVVGKRKKSEKNTLTFLLTRWPFSKFFFFIILLTNIPRHIYIYIYLRQKRLAHVIGFGEIEQHKSYTVFR